MPPPAEGFAAHLLLGPALRTQPDRRLVALVRDGYEAAFDEIVRRYGGPLRRYAATIVDGRSEDVTQDALSKALLALRRDGAEIELRPWLFRIVRNTALNDLRDRPPTPEVLAETLAGAGNPADELERREELSELIRQLQALPEPQRAAIVMRELEGLGHEEIATALGLSGGAARQAIYRARRALRDGLGMLLPLPMLKALLNGSASGPVEAIAGAGGTGVALKAATATVLVAGAVGAGVTINHGHRHPGPASAVARPGRGGESSQRTATGPRPEPIDAGTATHSEREAGPGDRGTDRDGGEGENGTDRGHRHGEDGGPAVAPEPGQGARDDGPASEPGGGESDGGGSSGKDDESGDSTSGSSGPGGDSESDGGGDSSGPGDGSITPSGEGSSGDGTDSNSGPGSGDGGTDQSSGSEDLRDPDEVGVFSLQDTQP